MPFPTRRRAKVTSKSGSNFEPEQTYRFRREDNTILIDIMLDVYRALYNVWDFSPANNRDLDEDLLQYLLDCLEEVPEKYNVEIVFHLPEAVRSGEGEKRSEQGYRNYFQYRTRVERARARKLYPGVAILVLIGFAFFAAAYAVTGYLGEELPLGVLSEAIAVGGWVAFWEAFVIVFFQLRAIRRKITDYERLLGSTITFDYRAPVVDPNASAHSASQQV